MRFTMVECDTWDEDQSPDFLDLSSDAKVVFFWAWQNRRAGIAGIYHASLRQVAKSLGRETEPVLLASRLAKTESALLELSHKPFVKYDTVNEVIWVVNRASHANRSPNARRGMRAELERCPPSPLRDAFIDRYGQMLGLKEG